MKNATYLVLALAMLAGCGEKGGSDRPKNLLTGNDFEQLEGWTAEVPLPSLTREKAHSGRFSMRVGAGTDFANGYIGPLGKLSATRLNKIQLKAWVFVPGTTTKTAVVVQLMDPAAPNNPLLWQAIPLDKATTTRNAWAEIDKTITLPANAGPNSKLYAYLWSGGAPNVAYIDDMQILQPE